MDAFSPDWRASWLLIGVALASGVAASYGRELEARRRPDRGWWLRRALVMPVLAIAASASLDTPRLSPSMAALGTAMLALGGYDMLRLVEARWRRWLEDEDPSGPTVHEAARRRPRKR